MPNQDLHQLVHALSKSEKRYLRMVVHFQNSGRGTNYELLLDALLRQPDYDHAALKHHFRGTSIANRLSAEKGQLFEMILRSLRIQFQDQRSYFRVRRMMWDVKLLFDRRLYVSCEKRLRKARELAEKGEDFPVLLEILFWQRRLRKELSNSDQQLQARNWDEQFQNLIGRIQNYHRYSTSYDDLLFQTTRHPHGDPLGTLCSDALMDQSPPANEFYPRHFYLWMRTLASTDKGDFETASKCITQLKNWWESHEELCLAESDEYQSIVAEHISVNLLLRKNNTFKKELKALHNLGNTSLHSAFLTDQLSYYLESLFLASRLSAPSSDATRVATWLKIEYNKIRNRYKFAMAYNLAVVFLLKQETSTALVWINKIVNTSGSPEQKRLLNASLLLRMVVHLELENYELVIRMEQNYRRSTRRLKGASHFEDIVLKSIRSLSLTQPKDCDSIRRAMAQDLIQLQRHRPAYQSLVGVREMILWSGHSN